MADRRNPRRFARAARLGISLCLGANGSQNSFETAPPQPNRRYRKNTVATLHKRHRDTHADRVDFAAVNSAALASLPSLLSRLAPCGEIVAGEYSALNPIRADRHIGSFRINLKSGRWADFATGDAGGDPVSLAAYVWRCSQAEAARRLAQMLGIDCGGSR